MREREGELYLQYGYGQQNADKLSKHMTLHEDFFSFYI